MIIIYIVLIYYFFIRNKFVYDFSIRLFNIDCKYGTKLNDKHSYEDMLFSFKPLKLKYWFTEEELRGIEEK